MSALSPLVVLAGAVPLGTRIWMRRGNTPRSRFWVREWTAWQPRRRLDAEMFFLVRWPVAAARLLAVACAGLLSLLGVGGPNLDVIVALLGGLAALAVIVVILLLCGIGLTAAPGGANLLRPRMYPCGSGNCARPSGAGRRSSSCRSGSGPRSGRTPGGRSRGTAHRTVRAMCHHRDRRCPSVVTTGEVIRVRFGGSARERAFAKLNRDLRRAARRSGTAALTITDTSNRNVRCPELIPTLLDWYENVDAKARFEKPRDRAQLLDAVARSLVTPDAPHGPTFRLAVRHLDSHPPVHQMNLQGSTLLAAHHASSTDADDRDAMARLAADRFLGEGRAPILEWLIARKVSRRHPELLDLAVGELEDPAVAAHIMRRLRRLPLEALPVGIEARVRSYLESEQEESRTQSRLLLERIAEQGRADE